MKKLSIQKVLVTLLRRPGLTVLFLVLLGGFMWSLLAYRDAKNEISRISSPEGRAQVARLEVDALLAKVGRLILLPEGEDPAVATIQDIEALVQSEAFYRGAKNGDKVIVYREKAIIYDPVNNKLVNVGPVYIQNQEEAPPASPELQRGEPSTSGLGEVASPDAVPGQEEAESVEAEALVEEAVDEADPDHAHSDEEEH